jgi:4-hydroxy-3-methylbut-2-enyl diphosphate reductase
MGFCFGVKRAVSTAQQAVQERGIITTLGHLVHNDEVVRRLECSGVKVAMDLGEITTGPVVISAHGVGQDTYKDAQQRGLEVIDATCPIVRQIQKKARQLSEEGFLVVVFGDRNHAEVRGVVGWTDGKARVVGTPDDLSLLPPSRKVAVLSQSTLPQATFNNLLSRLIAERMGALHQLVVHNTLCNATTSAQAAALELAEQVGVLVVVGGRASANTRHLAELCAESGVPTFHIEDAAELRPEWLDPSRPVGVTAGASTPDWIVNQVVARIEEIGRQLEAATKAGQ